MDPIGVGVALLAGVLSTLSPCVLPLLPVVVTTALSKHRLGPLALAAGLALSFAAIGLFVATVGFALGFDLEFFRRVSAVLLVGFGLVLLFPAFQARFSLAAAPLGAWTEQRFGSFDAGGFGGQFLVGLLLGAVWTPCVGPTLGAISLMAARREALGDVAATMLLFGIGTALPLLLLGALSRPTLMRWRGRLSAGGSAGRRILGLLLVAFGLLALTGLDRTVQAALVGMSPQWLTGLTTRF